MPVAAHFMGKIVLYFRCLHQYSLGYALTADVMMLRVVLRLDLLTKSKIMPISFMGKFFIVENGSNQNVYKF